MPSRFLINANSCKKTVCSVCREEWKDVQGYKGLYLVSNIGRVMNVRGSILKAGISKKGYLQVKLSENSSGNTRLVHRLVAESFILNPFDKEQVNHIDANKENNYVDNLEWSTQQENQEHAMVNGLRPHGETFCKSKLTEQDLLKIMALRGKKSHKEIGKEFDIDSSAISRIHNFKVWARTLARICCPDCSLGHDQCTCNNGIKLGEHTDSLPLDNAKSFKPTEHDLEEEASDN